MAGILSRGRWDNCILLSYSLTCFPFIKSNCTRCLCYVAYMCFVTSMYEQCSTVGVILYALSVCSRLYYDRSISNFPTKPFSNTVSNNQYAVNIHSIIFFWHIILQKESHFGLRMLLYDKIIWSGVDSNLWCYGLNQIKMSQRHYLFRDAVKFTHRRCQTHHASKLLTHWALHWLWVTP